jgi:hypothetical protein
VTPLDRQATAVVPRAAAARASAGHPVVDLRRGPVAPARGWPGAGGGRAAAVVPGATYLAASSQVAGLFPFVQAAGLPATGVPVGRDVLTRELVCLDPGGWVGTLTANPGVWVQAAPGVGKSALVKRVCLGLVALGHRMVCPGDVKGEYAPLTQALGGQVVRVGRGLDRINPLDSGPLGRRAAALPEQQRRVVAAEVAGRRVELLLALLATGHGLGHRPTAAERYALAATVRLLTRAHAGRADPVLGDVLRVLGDPPAELVADTLLGHADEFRAAFRPLVYAVRNLVTGPLAGLFDGPTTTPVDLAAPAVSVDLSSLLAADDSVVAAGLLACWAYTYGALDAAATAATAVTGRRPLVIALDEMWRALRAGPGLVDSFDSLTRLNRQKGAVTLMVTHSLRDTEALPTEADRAKAAGLMDRCDTLALGASSHTELAAVSARKPLTDAEIALVSTWASPTGTAVDGGLGDHPGRGRYLVKLGHRVGVPVRLTLDPAESALYDTDQAIRTARHSAHP